MTSVLKVLTINIWNRQGPWTERLELLRRGLERLRPDVVGLQEVLSDGNTSLAHAIADGLGYEVGFGSAKAVGGGIHFGNAVLSRFPITASETIPLPSVDTDEERCLLTTELDTPHGPLPFLCTHLSWRFHHGYVREQQARAIAQHIRRHAPVRGTHLPLVLVGDMNARPESTEVRFLNGNHALEGESIYLCDCFGEIGRGPGHTFDSRTNPFAAPTHELPRRIDYVFVRGPDARGRGIPLRCEVVLDEVVEGVAASDHFGVYAELRV
jgi:endonuclease/exonuclease/phosphatase family metal-dependent hydrolase